MASPVRTTFVTVLGWAFVGIGGLGAIFCALMALMISTVFQAAERGSPFGQPYRIMQQVVQNMPPPWPWFYAHQAMVLLVTAALLLLHVACAIGLLARRDMARRAFMGLMVMDIVLQGLSLPYMQHMQVASQSAMKAQMPPNIPPFFQTWMDYVMTLQSIEIVVRPIVLAAVFGWIIWRLRSDKVRREFSPARP